jgi:hypothetical protein
MHVIGHQAPSQHTDAGVAEVLEQEPQIRRSPGIGEENSLAVCTPLGAVIRLSGYDTALISRHSAQIVRKNRQNLQGVRAVCGFGQNREPLVSGWFRDGFVGSLVS